MRSGLCPEPSECRRRSIRPAHPVGAGSRGRRRGTQVHAPHAQRVRRERDARPEHDLPEVLGARDDVAADEVGVVGGHLDRRPHRHSNHPLPEAGGEPLELGDDRLGGVTRIAVRHVRVRVDRMNVACGALRVGQVLLPDEHKRSLRELPLRDGALVRDDLGVPAAEVKGARLVGGRVGPLW